MSKKQVNKNKDAEQSQPPTIDTKEPIQQDNQETEVTVETDIEYGVVEVIVFQVMNQMKEPGNISTGRRFRYENVDSGNTVDIYREGQSMELCGLHAINNMLGQNLEYMPNKQPYLANQLHTIATEMEQTEVGRASGQTFHTSSGQFNTDVLTKALRDSGWKLFKQLS